MTDQNAIHFTVENLFPIMLLDSLTLSLRVYRKNDLFDSDVDAMRRNVIVLAFVN